MGPKRDVLEYLNALRQFEWCFTEKTENPQRATVPQASWLCRLPPNKWINLTRYSALLSSGSAFSLPRSAL